MTTFYDCAPQVLKIHSDLLLALSQFFAEGGEKLPQTLSPLAKSCSTIADHYKLEKLLLAKETLANCSEAERDEHLLMTY